MNNNNLEFDYGVYALKLLGKNLYSNPLAAISELVANSIDAKAKTVWVYIDMRNKKDAILEITDDGIGMTYDDIKNKYCKIGFDKRNDKEKGYFKENNINENTVMGRKGIGKLAALYLSNFYTIVSKKNNEVNSFEINLDLAKENDDHPKLQPNAFNFNELSKNLNDFQSGTAIRIKKANLAGIGGTKLKNLEYDLGNYFAIDKIKTTKIFIKIVEKDSDINNEYYEIKKYINLDKIIYLTTSYTNDTKFYIDNIVPLKGKTINFLSKKLENKQYDKTLFDFPVEIFSFVENDIYEGISKKGKTIKVNYKLEGWIGIKSSIKGDLLIEDKENNELDKNELRLYVRNKLATKNLMPIFKNTQVFSKYIEGEVFFDLLDHNDFPDIATSSRQDFDESDERFILLKNLLEPKIKDLINKRLEVSKNVNKLEEKIQKDIDARGKEIFSKKIISIGIPDEKRFQIIQEIKGDVVLKDTAQIFISHSTKDKLLTDWIYKSLKLLGVTDNEIFYTSSKKTIFSEEERQKSIIDAMKKNIISNSTLMLYFISPNFLSSDSNFPLFEAGAGWVTKTAEKVILVSHDHNILKTKLEILYKGQYVYNYANKEESNLNIKYSRKEMSSPEYYNNFVVPLLNTCIDHLNEKRNMNGITLLNKLNQVDHIDDSKSEIINLWNEHFSEDNINSIIKI